jgi:hypothetical protein
MNFHITFAEVDAKDGIYKAVFKIGESSFSSPPQDIAWLFRDIIANAYFLSEKKLATFFFSEEPIANIRYKNDRIEAYVFQRSGLGSVELCGEVLPSNLLGYFNEFMASLEGSLEARGENRKELETQVRRDISEGVYDVYLNA